MSLPGLLITSLLCLSAGFGQSAGQDAEAKNYKLSMEKIKAYDSAMTKIKAVMASDPALQTSVQEAMKKDRVKGMMTVIEQNAKLSAILKDAGLSSRELLLIPSCLQVTASVYNSQSQGSAMGAMVSPENLAFYAKNKVELDQLIKSWSQRR